MILGVHAMFYSAQADALRAFLRDKLKLPFTDVGEGWLIFDAKQGEVGIHPTDHPGSPQSGTHSISLYCSDIERTVADLKARGVVFNDAITDRGYGLVTTLTMPGNVVIELYEPKYQTKAMKAAKKARIAARKAKTAIKPAPKAKKAAAKPARAKR